MKHSTWLRTGLLLGALALNGCAAVLVGGGAAAGYAVAKDERTAGEIASDGRITSQINAKLVAEKGVRTLDVNVDTYRGVVTLSGTAPTAEARQRVINAASTTGGVQKVVVKNLTVKPATR